ncbi:hypothetical protein OV079_15995 [Nannocystis pusilla]|uniref:Uncharacterized protein n=1 Tax=Nannocystis pusilla TaxID=889268 RepID=A0A9X3IW70_9BACT|nr:hypothetical protein [Nannocystis pusilla]MCY1007032.1 hypothetical protein [Nannocystis pusilla]
MLHAEQGAADVDGHHAIEGGAVDVGDGAEVLADPGGVDGAVEAAELGDGGGDAGDDVVLDGDVERDEDRRGAAGAQLLDDALPLGPATRGDHDPGPGVGEGEGGGLADARLPPTISATLSRNETMLRA